MLVCCHVMADGVFFVDKLSGNVTLENVVNNNVVSAVPVTGQTYGINKQNYAVKTSTNSEVSVFLSNDVAIKAKDSTHITFDNLDQTISNIESLPSKAKYSSYNGSLSLIEGELEIVSQQQEINESFYSINTMLASIILNKGKFIITADSKTTIIVVLEGSATVLDNSSKKKQTVKANNTVVIVPAPKFQGRGVDTMIKRGNIFTTKETASTDADSYLQGLTATEESLKHFRFIVFEKLVRGTHID
mgnify:CR=1 FL=1